MSKKKRDLWIGICIGNYKIRNGTTHPIELDKKTIKDFQSICDDYGKMFSTKLKMELGNPNLIGGYITDEDDFKLDMDRWLNDVDYYYDIFENHRKLFSKITFYIEHRFNQFCKELKVLLLHFGDKNHMGGLLEDDAIQKEFVKFLLDNAATPWGFHLQVGARGKLLILDISLNARYSIVKNVILDKSSFPSVWLGLALSI